MKQAFIFEKDTLEYTVKLKSYRWMWWLLLLLLPLLLLIRLEKDIYVKAQDPRSKAAVQDLDVTLDYNQDFLIAHSTFLYHDSVRVKNKTGSGGVALFGKLKYSVFSWIFKHHSKAVITASGAGCFGGDTAQASFHCISDEDTILLELVPTLVHADFKVVDADDGEALPGAKVVMETEFIGPPRIDTATTGQSGKVVFETLPLCGKVKKVSASAEGYYPLDSIIELTTKEVLEDTVKNKKRILRLKPIRKPITFYVLDCQTMVGLPGVKVTLDFEFRYPDRTRKETGTCITNEKGVGKGIRKDFGEGTFDSAAVVSYVHIKGSKEFYKDSFLTGGNGGWHKVSEFLKYPKEKRTFCLEPKPQSVQFINVDSINGQPIPNVANLVSITDAVNKKTETTVIGGANGQFSVSLKPNETISIVADHPPCYKKNDHTIRNEKSETLFRKPKPIPIPLVPVLVDLTFKTVEAADRSIWVPEADLVFTTNPSDGVINPPATSGNGEFTITVRQCANLTIVASKAGYKTNDYTIVNKSVELLQKSTEEEREIPLEKEADPCNIEEDGEGDCCGLKEYPYEVGNQKKLRVVFDHRDRGDEFWIYSGNEPIPTKELEHNNKLFTRNAGKITYDIELKPGDTSILIVVRIEDKDSSFEFKIICP